MIKFSYIADGSLMQLAGGQRHHYFDVITEYVLLYRSVCLTPIDNLQHKKKP